MSPHSTALVEDAPNLPKVVVNEAKIAVLHTILVQVLTSIVEALEDITEIITAPRVALPPTWVATFPANLVSKQPFLLDRFFLFPQKLVFSVCTK